MGEVIRTIKVAASLVVLLITGKVLLDLTLESYRNGNLQHWGLIGLFAAIASTAVAIVVATYALELPNWLQLWQIINLVLFAVAIYHMLTELREDD